MAAEIDYNKYQKLILKYSYNGAVWAPVQPLQYKKGEIIEANSYDCGFVEPYYRWVNIPGEYVCINQSKYAKEKQQVTYDSGVTWTDTGVVQTGQLIEANSYDCDYGVTWVEVPYEYICEEGQEPIYRWVDTGTFICQGYDKYHLLKEQISIDNGATWEDNGSTKPGSIAQKDSTECGYIEPIYQWVDTGLTECYNWDKYSIVKQRVSYDNGATWEDTGETKRGSVLESHSSDCPIDVNIEGSDITTWLTTNGIPFTSGIDLGTCQHIVTDCDGNYNSETWYGVQHYEWMTTTDSTVYELSTYMSFNNTSNPCYNSNRCLEYNYHLRYIVIPSEYNITQLIYDKGQDYDFTPKGHFQILKKVSDSWTYDNIVNGWRRFNTTATTWCDGGTPDETIIPIVIPRKYDDCETFWEEFNLQYFSDRRKCLDTVTDGTYSYYSGYDSSRTPYYAHLLIVDSNDNVVNKYSHVTDWTNVPSIVFSDMNEDKMFASGENVYYAFDFGFTTEPETTPQVENIAYSKISFGKDGWNRAIPDSVYSWGTITYTKVNNNTMHVDCVADASTSYNSYSYDLNVITDTVTNFTVR